MPFKNCTELTSLVRLQQRTNDGAICCSPYRTPYHNSWFPIRVLTSTITLGDRRVNWRPGLDNSASSAYILRSSSRLIAFWPNRRIQIINESAISSYTAFMWELAGFNWLGCPDKQYLCVGADSPWKGLKARLAMLTWFSLMQQYDASSGLLGSQAATGGGT